MATDDHPNVVVVFTDQQRWDTLGCYGNPMDITPNLDQAADAGTQFTHTFTPQPVCAPARGCMQTGQYATTNEVYTNGGHVPDRDPLLAREFAAAGYETGYVGKWHLAKTGMDPIPEDKRGGYRDYWRGADLLEFTSHPYEGILYDEDNDPVEFDGYRVDALTEMAIDFIETDRNQPFFLFLSYLEPHHQNDMGQYVGPEGSAYRHRNPWIPEDLRNRPGDWYTELPDYYGICERIDECYGRLIESLRAQDELENTIVLFTSDHGSQFITRAAEYKRTSHESSIRVPGIIRGPGFENTQTVDDLVSLIDFPPTLLDAAGLSVPSSMEGRSLVPLAANESVDWRDGIVCQPISGVEVSRVLRTDRWKYSVYAPDADPNETPQPDTYQERFLYDLAADPHEQVNLIGRGDHRAVADELREQLSNRIAEIEGPIEIQEAHYPT